MGDGSNYTVVTIVNNYIFGSMIIGVMEKIIGRNES